MEVDNLVLEFLPPENGHARIRFIITFTDGHVVDETKEISTDSIRLIFREESHVSN